MIDYKHVMQGIMTFMDKELLPKMSGYQRWIFGTGCGIAGKKCENIFTAIKDNSILKTLDLVDGDKINVDLLYEELAKQAAKGSVDIDVPMIGTIKLDKTDVDKLHRYITEESYER